MESVETPPRMPSELRAAIDRRLLTVRIQYLGQRARREFMDELDEIYSRTYVGNR